MDKYIFKPYVLGKNVVGVELNFNKEFYVPEQLESVEDILAELQQLDSDLQAITIWQRTMNASNHSRQRYLLATKGQLLYNELTEQT